MSESEQEHATEGIDDDQLPEDLRPDENPLAEGLEPGETVDGLLTDGKTPDQREESEESGGADEADEADEPDKGSASADAGSDGAS